MSESVVQGGATVIEGSGVPVMARVRLTTGSYMTQATVTSIARKVYYQGSSVSTSVLTVNTVVFDTLQTTAINPLWTKDTTGANFIDVIDDDVLVDGDKVYDVWYEVEPTSGPKVKFFSELHTIDDPSE